MNSIRKWLYRPKKTDTSLLAQFYFVDEDLVLVASELDSFDGRKDPERCTMLVNQLRVCQDKVLTVIQRIMDDAIPHLRANRDFRVKFPDDVLQDSLSGQLWFGAECLAAGSSILNREAESASMRPLARALTKNLDSLRIVLREQCLKTVTEYTERIREALVIFDKLFAEFELSYVSAMVPVKTMKEYDMLQEVTALFSETVQRALLVELITQDMVDDYDPALMFTIPRLAIVCGLLVYPEGPLNPDMDPTNMTEMFRPFQTLLFKIRELLYTLNLDELSSLEKSLCSSEEPEVSSKTSLAGHGLENLQIDQGFDEEGEGIIAMDLIGSNILIHPSGSGSPVTPVNTDTELYESVSPSSTIIDESFGINLMESGDNISGLNLMVSGDAISGLNKSESQDSGLHSENISTSDTVTVDVLPGITNQESTEAAATSASSDDDVQSVNRNSKRSPDSSRKTVQSKDIESIVEHVCESDVDSNNLCDTVYVNANESNGEPDTRDLSNINDCQSDMMASGDVRHLCQTLVYEIVENALITHSGATGSACDNKVSDNKNVNIANDSISETRETVSSNPDANGDSSETLGATGLSRQFSWQYNIQFASQNYHRLDTARTERNTDGGSISSDSTMSDQGAQDSVSDFVIETLSTMTQNRESGNSLIRNSSKNDLNPGDNATNTSNSVQPDRKDLNSASNQSVALDLDSRINSRTNFSLSIENSSQITKSQIANKTFKQRSKARRDRRESLEHINCKTGPQASSSSDPLDLPVIQTLKGEDSSSYSSCQSTSSECDCDKDCTCAESETSSCNSENNDEEEIALAIQAAELASRNEARSRFRSSGDLIHRLFVCIAGVADQLQTNYASDLRHILKCVFELNSLNVDEPEVIPTTPTDNITEETESGSSAGTSNTNSTSSSSGVDGDDQPIQETTIRQITNQNVNGQNPSPRRIFDEPPEWEQDDLVERCTACKTPFTFVRRRHHCRNCGKIFCGKCSSTTVPLPQYGHQKPVRVCHKCFLYQIAHFTM